MNELPTQKRRFVGPLVAVLILLGVAAYPVYWFTLRGGTSPDRIHVVVSGEPAGFATTLRGRLVHQLTQVGFEVMGIDDEAVEVPTDLDWDGALASADQIGARYLVHVEVSQDSERQGLTEGLTFVVATGSVRVGPVDEDEAEPGETRSLTFGAEGRGTDDALDETTEPFATTFRHWAAGDLLTMPALVARLEDPEHVGDAERQNALDDALERRAGQVRSDERFQEVCIESIVQLTIDDERGPAPFVCIEPSCGERYLFGLSADGTEALMHVEAPTFFVPFATSPAPRAAETVERLELAPLDGGEPRVLAVAQNFFGYGGMSDDGSRVTFVEQASRRFGVVALEVESSERRVLTVVERPGLVIQSRISPDGQWILWHQKAFNRAHTELHLMPFEGGEEAILSRRTRLGRWVHTPLRPGEEPRLAIIFDGTESYEGSPRPVLVDPTAPTEVVELDIGERVIRQVIGSHEGRLVLLGSERDNIDACILGVRDVATAEIEWKPLGTCVEDARLSDRGEVVGAAVLSREGDPESTDTEAIIMDIESGDTIIHTINRARERYVRAVGDRIVFERGIRSQFPAVHPNAVCWTTR